MHLIVKAAAFSAILALSACGTRSSASISTVPGAIGDFGVSLPPNTPDGVLLTSQDLTDRPYRSLGDISVDVSKWTLFDADPTRALVDKALREKAASIGADAVVLVRYGTVGVGVFTWGKLEGKGRAIQYALKTQ